MRKLPPFKAISHALSSVQRYAAVGIRFSLWWTAIIFALGLAGLLISGQRSFSDEPGHISPMEIASAAVGLVAFCSIAVNWHRFILKDDMSGTPLRLDENVFRYIGNSLLVVLMAVAPLLVLAVVLAFLPPMAAVLLLPAALVAGTFALALSIKLPAVALGRKDFGFKDALNSTHDNFWQLMSVFLVNAAIALVTAFILVLIASVIASANFMLGALIGLGLSMVFNVFYTLFSVSILSSLYGFFVEKRDF